MSTKKILLTALSGLIVAVLVTTTLVKASDLNQAASTLPSDDEWSIMAHASMGQNVGSSFLAEPINDSTATDYEKRILAITAQGGDPSTISSENFVAKLESMFDGNQIGDAGLLNDDIFGVLALKSAGINDSVLSSSRNFILNHQNSDGGWGFAPGVGSDSNSTAMAIAALSATGSAPGNAFDYLSSCQDSSGGYGFSAGQAADGASTAWVISGLISASQSVPDNAKSYLENLQLPDGSFKWHASDSSGSSLVTAYAVIALSGHGLPIRTVSISPSPAPAPAPSPEPTPSSSPSPIPEPNPSPSPSPISTPSPSPTSNPTSVSAGRVISSISPVSAAGGTQITITGTNLTDSWRGNTTIQFFNSTGGRFTYVGSSESNQTISHFSIPSDLPAGSYTLKVGPNTTDVSNVVNFTVTSVGLTPSPTPVPTVTSLTPTPIATSPVATSNLSQSCLVPIFTTNFLFPPEGGKIVTIGSQMYFVKTYESGCGGSDFTTTAIPSSSSPSSPSSTLPPAPSTLTDNCLVPIFTTNFIFPPEGGKIVTIGSQMYFVKTYEAGCANTGSTGTAVTPTPAPAPSPSLSPSPSPSSLPPSPSTISLSIHYNSTNIFTGNVSYSGQTVLSALQQASNENGFSVSVNQTSLGSFVSAIAGHGPSGASGWQYAVNGSVPSVGASSYSLHSGDSVKWFYGAPSTSPY